MKASIHNIKFRNKIILIFVFMFLCSTGFGSFAYYRYMSKDIVNNFQESSNDVMMQLCDTLSTRIKAVNTRVNGMLTNYTFAMTLSNYLNNPSDANVGNTLGVVADSLKNLESGESLIGSCFIHTEKAEFDNFVKIRRRDFSFQDSLFGEAYKENPKQAIQWFPVMHDHIFMGNESVIPCVWRFTLQDYKGEGYLVIQIKQRAIEEILLGKYQFFEKIVILDKDGEYVAGSRELEDSRLLQLTEEDKGQAGSMLSSEYEHEGEQYLVTYGQVPENGWQIYGLRSRKRLLESLGSVKNVLLQIGICLLAVCLCMILWFSHQLTDSLRRLEKRMSCVRNGDLNVRFFYPYQDEIGSLAKSFNYMIGEIQTLVQKQEETIEELKRERDRVEDMQKQKRKAELKALQAQINPHFLYNTLNAITWQAADQGAEEVSILSNSLGKFFRLSLSKGAEVISLKDEVEHVTSYLDIQSIRYRSRIQYHISIPREWMMQCSIIKLVLQPLAENSIYHGIKEKKDAGKIEISAEKEQKDGIWVMHLIVWDDGAGISPEKLESINTGLANGETDRKEGYGIYNVNERILLYYGESYGLRYESKEGEWTRAILTIPFENTETKP